MVLARFIHVCKVREKKVEKSKRRFSIFKKVHVRFCKRFKCVQKKLRFIKKVHKLFEIRFKCVLKRLRCFMARLRCFMTRLRCVSTFVLSMNRKCCFITLSGRLRKSSGFA